jgi:hypothetical protein
VAEGGGRVTGLTGVAVFDAVVVLLRVGLAVECFGIGAVSVADADCCDADGCPATSIVATVAVDVLAGGTSKIVPTLRAEGTSDKGSVPVDATTWWRQATNVEREAAAASTTPPRTSNVLRVLAFR